MVIGERPDRPASLLASVEKQQGEIARQFTPPAEGSGILSEKERVAQMSRERGANGVLKDGASAGSSPLAALQLYR